MNSRLAVFEDSTLIKMALAGQDECFMVLMDRHMAVIRRRIRWMVSNGTDLDDLLQEVLLKVWRHLSTFRSESSFRTWMTRVAINEVRMSHRRDRCRPVCQGVSDLDAIYSAGESPYQSLVRAETTQAVRGAVAALPPKYRQVLILRDLNQLSAQETAQFLQLNVQAVKTQLFRARRMLSATLQGPRNLRWSAANRMARCQ